MIHASTWTRRKPDTEVHVLLTSIWLKCPEEANPLRQEQLSSWCEAWEKGTWKATCDVFMWISWGMISMFLKLDCGSDCITVNMPKTGEIYSM